MAQIQMTDRDIVLIVMTKSCRIKQKSKRFTGNRKDHCTGTEINFRVNFNFEQ